MPDNIDEILAKLAKDVENAVHSLYRGEMKQHTAKARAGQYVLEAQSKVADAIGAAAAAVSGAVAGGTPVATSPRPSVSAPAVAGAAQGWTQDESDAVLKCINAWLPMGGPTTTSPDSLCIAPGKMLIPTWGERERARDAVKKLMK
jgi:hypothetical protein